MLYLVLLTLAEFRKLDLYFLISIGLLFHYSQFGQSKEDVCYVPLLCTSIQAVVGGRGAECLYIQIRLEKKPHPSFNSFPLTLCMTFVIHQKVWGNVGPLSEDGVIKSGGWLSRWIVSGKPVRPSSVINAFTSSQPDSLHQALFICNFRTSWSYPRLIPVEAAVKHLSTIRMDSNNFTSAQPDDALAHVCAMYFCLPALSFLYGCHGLYFVVTFVNPRNCGNSWLRCKCLINGRWNPHG